MDSFRDDLSYSLPLLVGFDLVEVDHGGWLSPMGGVGPPVVVECDPLAHLGLRLRTGVPGVQVDTLILQRPPKALDEHFVETAPLGQVARVGLLVDRHRSGGLRGPTGATVPLHHEPHQPGCASRSRRGSRSAGAKLSVGRHRTGVLGTAGRSAA